MPGAGVGRGVGAQVGLLFDLPPLTALPRVSWCSYQWIVHISSLKGDGVRQKDYWLEEATKSNPVPPSWPAAPPPPPSSWPLCWG